MNHYPAESFSKISELLEHSCRRHGAHGFSIGEGILDLSAAMCEVGPIAWALVIHADAIAKQAGVADQSSSNALPFTCIDNPQTPFGNQAIVQPGKVPLSVAVAFLDAALEHAVCLGIHSYGYSLEEWGELPDDQKVIPLEPYLSNLRSMWVNDVMERGTLAERVQARPTLIDRNNFHMLAQPRTHQSPVLSFPSAR